MMSPISPYLLTLSLVVSATVASSGCVDEDTTAESSALLTPVWTTCAQQGELCTFRGATTVRYGRDGRYTTAVFTDSVRCARASFPAARLYRSRNTCEFDAAVAPDGDAGHDHPADAGTDHADAADGSPHMPGGPYINTAAIPTGDPGTSSIRIETTSEQPGPSDGTGAFRTVCEFSHMNNDDPIVFPGQPGRAHLHAYFGNTGANAYSTASSLRNSGNSTCRGGILNRTAYWVPALIDSRGTPLRPLAANIYYKTGYRGVAPADVRPFPQGLRMIAGRATASGPQPESEGLSWGCEARYVGRHTNLVSISNQCLPGEILVMEVNFPQCWDGVNLDSPDHKSHMAHADGGCPASHPIAIPSITYQINYVIPADGTGGLRLASDMYDSSLPGGYSVHADWFEGWDPEIVRTFVERCDNPAVDCHSHLLGDGRAIYY